MPRNEDGEFELVLGNKQLLSVFFLVVVLLGVFFTMGYIVGRNSAPLIAAESSSSRKDTAAIVVDPAPAPRQDLAPGQVKVAEAPKPAETKPPAETKTDPAKPQSGPSGLLEPQPGERYLQVLATARTEADLIAASLRKKGFPAHVTASPSPALFRVWVGPFSDTAELSKTRDNLVAAGFEKPIVRTFK